MKKIKRARERIKRGCRDRQIKREREREREREKERERKSDT